MKKLMVLVVFLSLGFAGCSGACVDDGEVKSAVEKQGYSNVVIKEKFIVTHSYRGCSDSDDAAYKMQADNPKGDRVDIIVCAGWPFKGVTIRTK